MTHKKFCDLCGAEMPTEEHVAALPHNEATKVMWGTFKLQNGVVLFRLEDLCGTCAGKVAAYIETLKEIRKR